jgi:ethanolamine permease
MMLSHILLRIQEPELERPFRTPGGVFTTGVALVLSLVAFASTFVVSLESALWAGVFYVVLLAYFVLYSRHHLVAKSPDEEFAAITSAESELN